MANCRYCGSPLYDNMKFCGNCGQLVIQEELQEDPQTVAGTEQPEKPEQPAEPAPAGGHVPPQFGSETGTAPRPGSAPGTPGSAPVGTAAWQMQNASEKAGQTSAKTGPDSFGIASMILGIASIAGACCCCCWRFGWVTFVLSLVAGIAAIVFSVVAKSKAPDRKFSGMAVAGLVLGIIGVLLSIVCMLLVLFASAVVKRIIDSLKNGELKELMDSLGVKFEAGPAPTSVPTSIE